VIDIACKAAWLELKGMFLVIEELNRDWSALLAEKGGQYGPYTFYLRRKDNLSQL